ncbi:DnaJ domain-containing protein [Haloechinothrix alba]|uniref:DnaJ domain-containing protein n=1 Tax=Haloechinothrix alba TaxID=664784 RepID=A0A238V3M4_9PSEU|nr:J domain-containing protein [Haloechinothrix alba]SNR28684.1 DnaJ domain-containing protein [Haloechinothrix alba]
MDDSTARRILGVGPHASLRQARQAYTRRAKMVHPDRYAHAAPPARREAQRAMAELNEAWRTIQLGPPARPRAGHEPEHGPSRAEPPRPRGCEICGHIPANRIDIRSLTGLLVIHRSERYAGVLCRGCGTALCRDVQAQTLTMGWWGVLAVFVNLAVLVNNGSYFRMLNGMAWPTDRVAGTEAPLSEPMPATRKVTARVLPWVATVTAAVLVALLVMLLARNAP